MFLVSFGKKCVFKGSRLFLPFFIIVGLQKPFYIALTVDYFTFYLNVRDNTRISPFFNLRIASLRSSAYAPFSPLYTAADAIPL